MNPSVRTAVQIVRVAFVLVLFLGVVTVRAMVAGEREIAASTAALKKGDAQEAAIRARRAAGWYVPGAPHVRVAYDRLIALARAAEGVGDRETALAAWRGVRTAALETRWIVVPHANDLETANAAIARLSAASPRPPGTRTELPAAIERRQLEALAGDDGPRMPWTLMLVLSFVLWLAGSVMFVRRAVSGTGHVAWRSAAPGLIVAATGLVLWLLSLWFA